MSNDLVSQWKSFITKDEIYKSDLKSLNEQQILNSFDKPLIFGTAGIRGVMGFGSSKINELTIKAASYAYGQYLLKHINNSSKKGIIVGHDNRHNSKFFAKLTSQVLKSQGIKAFLYEHNELQPTPLVSYTIRKLQLAGGVIITASHNPKEYNGFKVYNEFGAQLLPKDTEIIQTFMEKVDVFKIKEDNSNDIYISNKIIDDYIEEVLKTRLRPNDKKVLKVIFSPQHGTSAKIGPKILSLMDIEHYNVKKQMDPNPDFKYTKTPNPEDGKSFNRAIKLARKKAGDLIVVTDPDADRLGVVVKYKRRYKYLNGNEVAALYLDYLITELRKNNALPDNSFIVKTVVSGDLAEAIAKRNNIKIYKTHVGFKNIAQLIEKKQVKNEKFLFAYEESFGFLLNPNIARDKDALQAMVGVVEMANYYKTRNINLYEKLEDLWNQYGLYRSTVQSQKMSLLVQYKLLERISKIKRVGNKKIAKIEDYRRGYNKLEPQNLVKIILENGSWFAIRPSGTEPKVKIYIQSIDKEKNNLIDVVMLEKMISNLIEEKTEVENQPKISRKKIAKYIIFIGIIIALFILVFRFVYQGYQGKSVFDIFISVFNSQMRIIWFLIIIWSFFVFVLDAWIRKRLLILQNEKVRLRYLIISSIMGTVISFITPLSIGGDAIVYWYLRKKGVRRAPLLSTIATTTILYQARIVVQTLILLPIGWPIYQQLLSGSSEAQWSLIWFIFGLSWNIFATFMIFTLVLYKKFQELIIAKSITFLEWIPFFHVYDSGTIYGRVQYELNEMRIGMKTLWSKWWIICEMSFYYLLPVLFQPQALVLAYGGFVRTDIPRGAYWAQIVANDIISTSNSLSFTPGGSGTLEWLTVTVNSFLFEGSDRVKEFKISANSLASGVDLNWKIILDWPKLIFSALLIGNIIIGERRIIKYSVINKNRKLSGKKIGRDTRVYIFTTIPWIGILLTWIILIFTLTV